ncbi:MAG: sugar ABC transporter permease [Mesorhizobium sp.]|uniref:carbohydrate ABC transporter permease n=1 Tax=Mesorhizobium sp. TaxID=1871066 RepID=UPI000FE56719|nr:sugar ABC transporter permease [Mesorhizobium sp.]RWB42901.1 MAG: sugar ABC transporter permease [Mesorhizobium sp.]RWB64904.1 MAG: sugar ABC transporter permease [Mesorhizobium sp.]RWB88136.1 MAG: sugar ABC transporter permease [Mesorhizobium sp.]RWD77328.1 MAG: sugar ABC transporter permease [Mesorhizobium sp.]TIU73278.1 MAG: sugar ABC transporter permease [Mesorhizobium sp.]
MSLVSVRTRGVSNFYASASAFLFVLPAFGLFAAFALLPTLAVIQYSFTKWDGISKVKQWIGQANYAGLLSDRIFWEAFLNTLEWSAIIVVINVGLGLVAAAVMARLSRGRVIIQTCFMVPVVMAPITTAIIWRWMYQPDGAINAVLIRLGLDWLTMPWLGNSHTALPAIAIAHCWSTIGLSIVIFLAGLQAVDEELYDAAVIDGASPIQTFWHVTLPAIRPVTAIVIVLTVTHAFKAFDLIWAMTKGGPVRASEILSTYMYKRGAIENDYGYGAAIAVALLVIVTLAMGIYAWLQSKAED